MELFSLFWLLGIPGNGNSRKRRKWNLLIRAARYRWEIDGGETDIISVKHSIYFRCCSCWSYEKKTPLDKLWFVTWSAALNNVVCFPYHLMVTSLCSRGKQLINGRCFYGNWQLISITVFFQSADISHKNCFWIKYVREKELFFELWENWFCVTQWSRAWCCTVTIQTSF